MNIKNKPLILKFGVYFYHFILQFDSSLAPFLLVVLRLAFNFLEFSNEVFLQYIFQESNYLF